MKKTLVFSLLILAITSCKKKDESEPKRTQTTIRTYKVYDSGAGKTDTTFIQGTIYIWDKAGKDLEIRDIEDAVEGYAYDKISGQRVRYSSENRYGILVTNLFKGKYLAFAIDDITRGEGQLAFSYKHFEVNEEPKLFMDKTFSLGVQGASFEEWK